MIALLPLRDSGRWISWVGSIRRAKEHPDALMKIPQDKGAVSGNELFDLLAEFDYVSVLHHSLIPGKWPVNIEKWNHAIDAVELPGKHLEKECDYRSMASKWGKPIIGGSDAHTWIQLGVCRTEIQNTASTHLYFSPKTLKIAFAHGQAQALPMQNSSALVNLTNLYRTRLDLKYRSAVENELSTFAMPQR
jgi:hypothetical protein